MAYRPTYPVTRRLTWSPTFPDALGGVLGTTISLLVSISPGLVQSNLAGSALTATVSVAGDVLVTGGGGGFTPSLDFSDARNSQYVSVAGF